MHLHRIELGVSSCFIIREKRITILIDTGYERDYELLRRGLAERGISIESIDYIIVTHAHDDHVGSVKRIRSENPEARLIISEKGREFIATGKHVNFSGAGYINRKVALVLKIRAMLDKGWTHTFPAVEVGGSDIFISRDTRFEELGIPFPGKVLMTPGHTFDHISVLLDDGRCICGDAAANFLGFLGLRNCVISANDLDEYYRSWEKFLREPVKVLLPSHGKEFSVEKIRKNIWKNKKEDMVLWKLE